MRTVFVLSVVFFCIISPDGVLADGLKLSDYEGVWRGKGLYERTTSKTTRGKLVCKFTVEANGPDRISVSGRCAAPEGSRSFSLNVTANGGQITSRDPQSGRVASGQISASGISLKGNDSEGETIFLLSDPSRGQMRWTMSSIAEDETRHGSVIFKRR